MQTRLSASVRILTTATWAATGCLLAPSSPTIAAALRPGDEFRDCDACPEMVVLPVGRFTMGSAEDEENRSDDEGPRHDVVVARPIAMGKYEVTHEEFATFVRATGHRMEPCFHDPVFPRTDRHPALCLSFEDAEAYVAWLSVQTGKTYRLPSEAEWEYAARGATEPARHPRFSFGNEESGLCRNADTAIKTCDDGFEKTAPIGSFPANTFGLHDMHGNVWEMASDCTTASYEGAPSDGSRAEGGDCSKRIIRGGSWANGVGHQRAANRGWIGFKLRDVLTGLRVVITVEQSQ